MPEEKEVERYAVSTDYGEYYFRSVDDAVMAIEMLLPYHNLNIEIGEVRQALDFYGHFESFPIGVYKC